LCYVDVVGYDVVDNQCRLMYMIILHVTLTCARVAIWLKLIPINGLKYLVAKSWRKCIY
jgi:hypothetical protein